MEEADWIFEGEVEGMPVTCFRLPVSGFCALRCLQLHKIIIRLIQSNKSISRSPMNQQHESYPRILSKTERNSNESMRIRFLIPDGWKKFHLQVDIFLSLFRN